ncbi:MAG: DUF3488 and transglutaminase-like domain-containing protein [Gemmataceae bacterium]|nr:DUF3488 and transglutaminase-like domain-containing protein [Gemmataceae bacterium]
MTLESAFRLSFYLTLGLACACLAYAENPVLPEMALLTLPIAVALVAGYLSEGRWAMSVAWANAVAGIIAACVAVWTFLRMVEAPGGPAADGTLLWVRLLPHLGFLLIILMLAKLFRPKGAADYWFLFGMAFVAVALACALDNDFPFGLLLLAFLVCVLWSLALFYLHAGQLACAQEKPTSHPTADRRVPWGWLGTAQAARRCLLIVGLAFALFILTPRAGTMQWDGVSPRNNQYSMGMGDAVIDLNRTGTVRLNSSVAFEVAAEDAKGNAKLDLSTDQRWRSFTLNHYERGRWFNRGGGQPGAIDAPPPPVQRNQALPDLGPRQFFLTFTFPNRQARRLILAEPVLVTDHDPRLPVVFLSGPTPPAWPLSTGVLPPLARTQKCSYRQVCAPPYEADVNTRLPGDDTADRLLDEEPPVPEVQAWTRDLLRTLVSRRKLTLTDIRTDVEGVLLPENHEKVARALEAFLATSGEYSYTLELTRDDASADPIYDFLCNVKQGHCERFASSLALMLRSQGIPARLVLGFRGTEGKGDGTYVVRNNQAHSWVEVLVKRPGVTGEPEDCWLSLDPTAGEDAGSSAGFWSRWVRMNAAGGSFWRNFVVDYNAEQQEVTALEMWNRMGLTEHSRSLANWKLDHWGTSALWPWLGGGLTIAAGAVVWWLARRPRSAETWPRLSFAGDLAFYGRFLGVLAQRYPLRPDAAQTPREFAERVGLHLCGKGDLADIPREVTALYYQVRYAHRRLDPVERTTIERKINRLEQGTSAVEKHPRVE